MMLEENVTTPRKDWGAGRTLLEKGKIGAGGKSWCTLGRVGHGPNVTAFRNAALKMAPKLTLLEVWRYSSVARLASDASALVAKSGAASSRAAAYEYQPNLKRKSWGKNQMKREQDYA